MIDCVFCKIASNKAPSKIKKETPNLLVFDDINPKADIHVLIIPKKHIVDISDIDDALWNEIRKISLDLKDDFNLSGFRLITNYGTSQMVKHLHVHFLGNVTVDREL